MYPFNVIFFIIFFYKFDIFKEVDLEDSQVRF